MGEQSEPPDEGTRQLDAECLHMSIPPESPLESTDLPSTQELLDNALRQTISLSSSFGNVEEEEEAAAAVSEEVTDT
ncbi:unnamed protein product [Dibothriocephalus latus]|uniref:Uncharacterized protein n=1 Tax=Dibothriocephalus latus TaxID=60516 RepID=A0A3P7N6F2_DIBLA|nr:unnamed protein product [Dibothriocephalus latus]